MPDFPRHFTVREANALLPKVRRVLAELHELQPDLFQSFFRAATTAGGNGHRATAAAYRAAHERASSLIQELTEEGLILKDIERGLIDFPHLRHGREVFLCWEQGDESVRYWHELDGGYNGRRPI